MTKLTLRSEPYRSPRQIPWGNGLITTIGACWIHFGFWKNQNMVYDYECDLTGIGDRSLTNTDESLTDCMWLMCCYLMRVEASPLPVFCFALLCFGCCVALGRCMRILRTVSYFCSRFNSRQCQ